MDTKRMLIRWDPAGATGHRFVAQGSQGEPVPMDSGEAAGAASPVEMVLAALGACTGIDVVDILRKKRQAVTAYEIAVEGVRRDEHPRVYTHVEVVHRLTGRGIDPAAVAHAVELSDTKYCTIHGILAASGCTLATRFEVAEG